MVSCFYCQREVNEQKAWRRIQGWEKKAKAPSRRGGSDVVLRESINEWACGECVTRLQLGLNVAQDAML